jgi:hypothetical protein
MNLKLKEIIADLENTFKPTLKLIVGGKKEQQKPDIFLLDKEIIACCQATD